MNRPEQDTLKRASRGRTNDESDRSVSPQGGRLKFLLRILKGLWNGQPVKVNRSLGEILAT